jgi:Skp family chaperone for outer membrane proteins
MALLVAGLTAWCMQSSCADIKAATIDMDKLLLEAHIAKKEISVLKGEQDKYLKARKTRQEKLNELATKIKEIYAKLANKAMPKAERTNLSEQQDGLVGEYKSLAKDIKESDSRQIDAVRRKIARETRRLLDEFQVVIHSYASDNGYHWVIDTSGSSNSQISPLIYARNTEDITEHILEILNKAKPESKPGTTPEPGAAPTSDGG